MFNNYVPFVKPVFQNRIENVQKALTVLNKELESKTFLVGDRITLADISLAGVLADAFSKFLGPEDQKKFANVVRFEQTVINHPKIAKAFEGVSLATEVATYTPPKKDAPAKAPKAESAPKAPKAKAPKADDDEEEEPSFQDAPAPKNPLELLPKPALNLIDVKVKYSNTDTKVRLSSDFYLHKGEPLADICMPPSQTEFIPWFFEQDLSGYSAHKIDFKYNDELTLPFMVRALSRLVVLAFSQNLTLRMYTSAVGQPDWWLLRPARGLAQVPVRLDGRSWQGQRLDHHRCHLRPRRLGPGPD